MDRAGGGSGWTDREGKAQAVSWVAGQIAS